MKNQNCTIPISIFSSFSQVLTKYFGDICCFPHRIEGHFRSIAVLFMLLLSIWAPHRMQDQSLRWRRIPSLLSVPGLQDASHVPGIPVPQSYFNQRSRQNPYHMIQKTVSTRYDSYLPPMLFNVELTNQSNCGHLETLQRTKSAIILRTRQVGSR